MRTERSSTYLLLEIPNVIVIMIQSLRAAVVAGTVAGTMIDPFLSDILSLVISTPSRIHLVEITRVRPLRAFWVKAVSSGSVAAQFESIHAAEGDRTVVVQAQRNHLITYTSR
jgi:hypothetical protein